MSTSSPDKKEGKRGKAAQRATSKRKATAKPSAKATAAEATRRAKNAGAKGPAHRGQMSKHAMRMRNAAVVASVEAGESTKVIAERWGITQRSVDRIVATARENPVISPLGVAPVDLVEQILLAYRQQVVDATSAAIEYADKHPAASIAAQRLRGEALRAYAELLTQVGKIPTNLELFRSEAELQRFVDELKAQVIVMRETGDVDVPAFLAFLGQWAPGASGARLPHDATARVIESGERAA